MVQNMLKTKEARLLRPLFIQLNLNTNYSLSISSTLRFTKAVKAAPDSRFCDSNARS